MVIKDKLCIETTQNRTRSAFSLVELLIAIAILAILAGLTMSGVQKARHSAIRTESANKVKQICIAMQNYAASNNGSLPSIPDPLRHGFRYTTYPDYLQFQSPLHTITQFIDGEMPMTYDSSDSTELPDRQTVTRWRNCFVSPADPSIRVIQNIHLLKRGGIHPSSYSFNLCGFEGRASLTTDTFSDGKSSTIAFAERYAMAGEQVHRDGTVYDFTIVYSPFFSRDGYRRASFADPAWQDVVPITEGSPPVSRPSIDGVTFVCMPDQANADDRVLNSSYPNDLLVGYFDGSVRFLHRSINVHSFWAMVTRDKGDSTNSE